MHRTSFFSKQSASFCKSHSIYGNVCMEMFILFDHEGFYRFQIGFESTKEQLKSIIVFNSDSCSI